MIYKKLNLKKTIKTAAVVALVATIVCSLSGCSEVDLENMINLGDAADTVDDLSVFESAAEPIEPAEPEVFGEVIVNEEEETKDIKTITISCAGDCSIGSILQYGYEDTVHQYYDIYGPSYFFKNVKDIFANDDMTLVNFEGVLTTGTNAVEKTYNIKGKPEYIHALTEGSIECVSFANNHNYDYDEEGFAETKQLFEDNGIVYAVSDEKLGIYETKGIKIGYVAASYTSRGDAIREILDNGIAELKNQGADIIICYIHWGIERNNYPEEYQQDIGKKCIEAGADLVLGSHPHVLQGVGTYHDKFIVYSLGNFCFGANMNPSDKDTMIFQQTFTFVDGEKQPETIAKIIPCCISSSWEKNTYCPTPANENRQRIIDKVNEFSAPYGGYFNEDGYYEKKTEEIPQDIAEEPTEETGEEPSEETE